MARPVASPRYLSLDELNPFVEMASHCRLGPAWYRYRVPGHHLVLLIDGSISASTPHGKFAARGGDLVCFRPTQLNEYGQRAPVVLYEAMVTFAPPPRHQLTPWFDGIGPLPQRVSLDNESLEDARRQFETICLEITQTGPTHELRVRAAIFELLAVVAAVGSQRASSHSTPGPEKHLDPWQRVRQRLGSELERPLRISSLAREVGVGVDHFIRAFKARFHQTPKAYHNQARLREAARRLRTTDAPVKTVAYSLGFSDVRAMARLLRRHAGVSPTDLRSGAPPRDSSTQVNLPPKDMLFPMNVHLVGPGVSWDFEERFQMPRVRER